MKHFVKVLMLGVLSLSACAKRPVAVQHAGTAGDVRQISQSEQMAANRGNFSWKQRGKGELAPGFEILISHPDDEKLNGTFRVGFDGVLKLPYDINVQTNGLNEAKLKDKIVNAYKQFFQSTPNIQVSVTDKMYWVDVRGLVKKPGQYLFRDDSSLDEVIAAAEGLQSETGGEPMAKYVRIKQDGQTTFINIADYFAGAENLDPHWQGGEIVFLQSERGDGGPTLTGDESNYIRALGQVQMPGEYQFKSGADFYYYLIKAGGPTDKADLTNVEIVRTAGNQTQSIVFSVPEDETLPTIQGGDVVIVHADAASAFEKKTRIIGSVASIITSLATVVILAFAI